MNITADTYGDCENQIANVMVEYPRACPTRLAAIRQLRDGMADVIAEDVVNDRTPDEGTMAKYAAFVQLLADEVGA